MSAGKGRGPEKGRDHTKFRSGWDGINWSKKPTETKAEKPRKK
jgi:hypothetical protein